jgi:hypothetical protein
MQREMLAQFDTGRMLEHASSAGAASERHWLTLLEQYMPQRYRARPAFVVDRRGRRSRQIDIAIFDHLYSGPLFPDAAGVHIPVESVYAVFEVKPTFSRQWLREAAEKAESVRTLTRGTGGPILAGLLASTSVWSRRTFAANLRRALEPIRLDLGCCLEHGSFETRSGGLRPRERQSEISISEGDESLAFFLVRLMERLREMGAAPAADLTEYAKGMRSFRR